MENINRVRALFFEHPMRGFSLREIERELKLGLPSVRAYVAQLAAEGIVASKKIQRMKLHFANLDSRQYRLQKSQYNVRKLYASGTIEQINKGFSHPTIVLFGSKARGEDLEGSDWDLYVESQEKKANMQIFGPGEIQMHVFKRLSQVPNKHLRNNIINGIVLEGYLKVY